MYPAAGPPDDGYAEDEYAALIDEDGFENEQMQQTHTSSHSSSYQQHQPSSTAATYDMPSSTGQPLAMPTGWQRLLSSNPQIQLLPIEQSLPQYCHSIFQYPYFNPVQTQCFNVAYHGNDQVDADGAAVSKGDMNFVVSSPTGSGKTVIMELAILHCYQRPLAQNNGHMPSAEKVKRKVVYVAPLK